MGCHKCAPGDTYKDRAAVCVFCPHSWRSLTRRCGVTGRPVTLYIMGVARCPKRKHGEVTRAWWRRFYGPFPLARVVLWAVHPRHPKWSSFSGCGCWVPLKDWADRLLSKVNWPAGA